MQTEFSTPDLKDGFQIDVYVDPNLIEVFVNDGELAMSTVIYTDLSARGICFSCDGTAEFSVLKYDVDVPSAEYKI